MKERTDYGNNKWSEDMDCRQAEALITPYIQDKLTTKELEEFLMHIENCKSCYEELEIYYTLLIGLQKLESGGNDSEKEMDRYDFKNELNRNLAARKQKVNQMRTFKMYYRLIMIASSVILTASVIVEIGRWFF